MNIICNTKDRDDRQDLQAYGDVNCQHDHPRTFQPIKLEAETFHSFFFCAMIVTTTTTAVGHLKDDHDDGKGHEKTDAQAALQHGDDEGNHDRAPAHHPEEHPPRVKVLGVQSEAVSQVS